MFIEVNSKNVKLETYEKAIRDAIYKTHQKKAIYIKLETLHLNNTWELVDFFAGRKAIGSKWVIKVKYNKYRQIIQYKTRFITCGYAQQHNINYSKTFSPTI